MQLPHSWASVKIKLKTDFLCGGDVKIRGIRSYDLLIISNIHSKRDSREELGPIGVPIILTIFLKTAVHAKVWRTIVASVSFDFV